MLMVIFVGYDGLYNLIIPFLPNLQLLGGTVAKATWVNGGLFLIAVVLHDAETCRNQRNVM